MIFKRTKKNAITVSKTEETLLKVALNSWV